MLAGNGVRDWFIALLRNLIEGFRLLFARWRGNKNIEGQMLNINNSFPLVQTLT